MEDFIRDEIYNILNNYENEKYCKLTNDDIDTIVEETIEDICMDNELNSIITSTIIWYVDHYIANYTDVDDRVEDIEV